MLGRPSLALVLLAAGLGAEEAPPADPAAALLAGRLKWVCGAPLIGPDHAPAEPCVSIKDPTAVFHENRWHLFATYRAAQGPAGTEYLSFADWKSADAAPRVRIPPTDCYHCAPQLFYYTPHKLWYLLTQWTDKSRAPPYFGPAFSTTPDPGQPEKLTPPVMLFPETPESIKVNKKWLDFWIICDSEYAYLFFTSLDGRLWRSRTKRADFPKGWSNPEVALRTDLFEASHTYRLKGMDKYLTIVEAQGGGGRYYQAYLADKLDGAWKPLATTLAKPFAGKANLRFGPGVEPWTDSVSHGELLREGNDETLTVDPAHLRFLIQGCKSQEYSGRPYGQIPWRLGLLEAEP